MSLNRCYIPLLLRGNANRPPDMADIRQWSTDPVSTEANDRRDIVNPQPVPVNIPCLRFNGVDDYVLFLDAVDHPVDFFGACTISGWVNPDPSIIGQNACLCSLDDGAYRIMLLDTGNWKLGTVTDTNIPIRYGEWQYVEVVFDLDGAAISMSVDGVVGWTGVANGYTSTGSGFGVGARPKGDLFFKGAIQRFCVSGFLDCNSEEKEGPKDYDCSGNGNHGDIITTDLEWMRGGLINEEANITTNGTDAKWGEDTAVAEQVDSIEFRMFLDNTVYKYTVYSLPIGINDDDSRVFLGNVDDQGETLTDETFGLVNASADGITYLRDEVPAGWHDFKFAWNGSSYDISVDGEQKITYADSDVGHAPQFSSHKVTVGSAVSEYYATKVSYLAVNDTVLLQNGEFHNSIENTNSIKHDFVPVASSWNLEKGFTDDSGVQLPALPEPMRPVARFDGEADYIDLGFTPTFGSFDISIDVMITKGEVRSRSIFGAGSTDNSFGFMAIGTGENSGYFHLQLRGNINIFAKYPGSYEFNRWYSLRGTYDGSRLKLYVDGVLVADEDASAVDPFTFGTNLRVGDSPRGGTWGLLLGQAKNARFSNSIASEAVDMPLDDGKGTITNDQSGNGHDGTITFGDGGEESFWGVRIPDSRYPITDVLNNPVTNPKGYLHNAADVSLSQHPEATQLLDKIYVNGYAFEYVGDVNGKPKFLIHNDTQGVDEWVSWTGTRWVFEDETGFIDANDISKGLYPSKTGWSFGTVVEYDSNWIDDNGYMIQRDWQNFKDTLNLSGEELNQWKIMPGGQCGLKQQVIYNQGAVDNFSETDYNRAVKWAGEPSCQQMAELLRDANGDIILDANGENIYVEPS